ANGRKFGCAGAGFDDPRRAARGQGSLVRRRHGKAHLMDTWPYPRWVAHRGAGKLAPENTLAAFRTGASHGYRMFECDAKLSADGVPFLMHDSTLERTTNGTIVLGPGASATAGDHPWSVLSQLDAGSWHSRAFAGEPLP